MPAPATVPTRRSYEAAILLVVLDDRARAVLARRPSSDLEAVDVLDDLTGLVGALDGADGSDRPGPSSALETRVHAADMVVLLVGDLAAADTDAALAVCDTARAVGRPCVVVGLDHDAPTRPSPDADRAAVLLREAVDTLVAVRDPDLALGFVDVLRGGSRDGAPDTGPTTGPTTPEARR